MPGAALRQVCLRLGDTMLELLEYRTPPSPTERPLLSHCIGASHVAFQVDDIEAAKAELEGHGVPFYSDINVVDDGVLAGWRWVYFADPDGYPLELVENAYERPGGHAGGIARYLQTRPAGPRPLRGDTCAPCGSTRPASCASRRCPSPARPARARCCCGRVMCGICGTDLHEYTDGPIVTPARPHPLTGAELPQIMGHEFAAVVAADR